MCPARKGQEEGGGRRAGRQPPLRPPLRFRPDRQPLRLRRRAVRRVHGAARWRRGPLLHHAGRERRAEGDHDDRSAGRRRAAAPGAAGVPRRRGLPVRLLHVGHGDGDRRPAQDQPESHRARHRAAAGSQRLPLRHLPAHRQGGAHGGGADAHHLFRDRRKVMERPPSYPSPPSLEPERYELSEGRRSTFELERRAFLKVFGGGLVVMVAATDALAQESGRARPQGRGDTPDLAAWLHIDENGRVQVSTGKVEIGQNIRTSLAQTVADELRVPVASIVMVMADTAKTPFDMGTFGSMTTPRMAPQLARAAATAREMLIDQAAARWSADRATLSARDGRIVAKDGRALTYGELTKGQALSGTIPASPATDPTDKWQVRGTAVPKVDGRAFVTGAHEYTPDVKRPGLLYGRIIRPDGYEGTLVNVDASRASAMAGVKVVRDGDFLGVVAPTERAAVRAVGAVQATWKVPPGQPSAQTIYDYL